MRRRLAMLALAGLLGALIPPTPAEAGHRQNRCGGGWQISGGWGYAGRYVTYDGTRWRTYPAGYYAPAPQYHYGPQNRAPAGTHYYRRNPQPAGRTMMPPPPFVGG